jgi:hypothetical protein
MVFWAPYPWYIEPLPMVFWPPTYVISNPLPMVFWSLYPWYFEPHIHGISKLLSMVFWTPTHGISNPLSMSYRILTHGILTPVVQYTMEMGIDIPLIGGWDTLCRGVKISWVEGPIYHM